MILLLSLLTFLQLPFISYTATLQDYIDPIEHTLISTYEQDVTNDGSREIIQINGQLLSKNSNYYHKISVDIKNKDSTQWRLTFPGGYEPQIGFFDLTQNGKVDMLYQSLQVNDDNKYHQHLYTFNNNNFTEIQLPKHHYIKGEFKDDFYVQIQTSPLKQQSSLSFPLGELAEKYIDDGIYNAKGKQLKNLPLKIGSISFFRPIQIGKDKGYGLKSYQPVYGINDLDPLGNIETTWYYDNNQWIILKIDFHND